MNLKENYKDAVFEGIRRYNQVQNQDGTTSLVDVTNYIQEGDRFGARDINATNTEVNRLGTELEQAKKSVSDGKTKVAAAITRKKVSTAATATFDTMAANIDKIVLGSGNATANKVLAPYTFTNSTGVQQTGTIQSKAATTYRAGTANQTIAAGQYLSGAQTIQGDANLIGANIISGKSIFGIAGMAPRMAFLGASIELINTQTVETVDIVLSTLGFTPFKIIIIPKFILPSISSGNGMAIYKEIIKNSFSASFISRIEIFRVCGTIVNEILKLEFSPLEQKCIADLEIILIS